MAEKKRLHHFLNDMFRLSCVKGFKHFATHMRGREEMVCSIVNEPSMPIIQSATNSPAASFSHHKREAVPMSQKQQRRLSGYGFINVGLPPASPSEDEEVDENQTMFLIAGYSRYNRPYVWVRTNHERLVRLSSEEEKDYPLLLQTTSQWPEKDMKVWDVLTELVEVCSAPSPPNPFAVDLDYFQALQPPERTLASAAMIAFLQRLIASGPHHYDRRVHSDIGKISRVHFQAMLGMLQEGIIQPPSLVATPSSKQQQDSQTASRHGKMATSTVPTRATPGLNKSVSSAPSSVSSIPSSSAHHPPSVTSPHSLLHPASLHSSTALGPVQYGTGASSTPMTHPPPHHPQPQPPSVQQIPPHSIPSAAFHPPASGPQPTPPPPPQRETGGQFYSRRMGGSYNY